MYIYIYIYIYLFIYIKTHSFHPQTVSRSGFFFFKFSFACILSALLGGVDSVAIHVLFFFFSSSQITAEIRMPLFLHFVFPLLLLLFFSFAKAET